jgi:hypothetical protein
MRTMEAVRCPPASDDHSEGAGECESRGGSLVQQFVLSGERENENLTWEETDRTAVQALRD